MAKVTFLDVLERAYSGPFCNPREWDTKIVPGKVNEKLKEYSLERTCNSENPINNDNNLADEFWKAGFDLAVDTGVYYKDTSRIIKFTEDELKHSIKDAPSRLTLGQTPDNVLITSRKPEDKAPVVTFLGPYGTAVDEDLFVAAHYSCTQHRVIDMMCPGTLGTVYGRELRSGTPYELIGGMLEAKLVIEAKRRAGRLGMPFGGVCTDATGLGQFGGFTYGGYSPLIDFVFVSMPVVQKVTGYLLAKAAHAHEIGAAVEGYSHPLIGGYSGGPEGTALARISTLILMIPLFQAVMTGSTCYDMRYLGDVGREAVWADCVSNQAVARNSHLLIVGELNPVSGPCTENLLYEATVASIRDTVSGASILGGLRSGGGRYPNYTTGLENKHAAEVGKFSCGMKCTDANEIIKKLIPKYEDQLRRPPRGKPFNECYDIKTVKPSNEWLGIYEKVTKDLMNLGLTF